MLVKVNNQLGKNFDGFIRDIFNEFPSQLSKSIREDVLHFPPANIIDSADNYVLQISAPGFEKLDFKVSVDKNILSVSVEKAETVADENSKLLRKEFSIRSFKRSFTVDEKIDVDNISAKYESGILSLNLPKREIAKSVTKEITIA